MAKLYLITLDNHKLSHMEQAKLAINENVPFLQLRLKNSRHEDINKVIEAILPELEQSETKLIINDHIEFLGARGVAGVHLGQNDISLRSFDKLRVTLNGKKSQNDDMLKREKGKAIQGITANTEAHIKSAIKYGASYIGLGPFRYTTTKSNLAKTLGIKGIRQITNKYAGIIPIYAIGGISLENINELDRLGLSGAALSSAVFASSNPRQSIKKFTKKLDAFAEAIHA